MSENIGGKIDLTQLKHVIQKKKGKSGDVEVLVIPIEANNLFKGKDNNVYLDLIAFPLREVKDYATHLVKQSLPKDVREKMSKEDQDAMPIFGNLKVGLGGGSSAPNNAAGNTVLDESDDLPF
jgi:hypothetical protein